MKFFATDLLHKYVYSIVFILLSTALMPTTYAVIVSYFLVAGALVALAGQFMSLPKITLMGNGGVALFSAMLAAGLLIYGWDWMD